MCLNVTRLISNVDKGVMLSIDNRPPIISFKSASIDLCNALAGVARRLCTSSVQPESVSAFVACRLIPLKKNPGVRPTGIGEVPRRTISKSILKVIGQDIQSAAGPLQSLYTSG